MAKRHTMDGDEEGEDKKGDEDDDASEMFSNTFEQYKFAFDCFTSIVQSIGRTIEESSHAASHVLVTTSSSSTRSRQSSRKQGSESGPSASTRTVVTDPRSILRSFKRAAEAGRMPSLRSLIIETTLTDAGSHDSSLPLSPAQSSVKMVKPDDNSGDERSSDIGTVTMTIGPSVSPEHSVTTEHSVTPGLSVTPGPSVTPEIVVTTDHSVTTEHSESPTPSVMPEHSLTPELSVTPGSSVTPDISVTTEHYVTPTPSLTPEHSTMSEHSTAPGSSAMAGPTVTTGHSVTNGRDDRTSVTTEHSVTPGISVTPEHSTATKQSVTDGPSVTNGSSVMTGSYVMTGPSVTNGSSVMTGPYVMTGTSVAADRYDTISTGRCERPLSQPCRVTGNGTSMVQAKLGKRRHKTDLMTSPPTNIVSAVQTDGPVSTKSKTKNTPIRTAASLSSYLTTTASLSRDGPNQSNSPSPKKRILSSFMSSTNRPDLKSSSLAPNNDIVVQRIVPLSSDGPTGQTGAATLKKSPSMKRRTTPIRSTPARSCSTNTRPTYIRNMNSLPSPPKRHMAGPRTTTAPSTSRTGKAVGSIWNKQPLAPRQDAVGRRHTTSMSINMSASQTVKKKSSSPTRKDTAKEHKVTLTSSMSSGPMVSKSVLARKKAVARRPNLSVSMSVGRTERPVFNKSLSTRKDASTQFDGLPARPLQKCATVQCEFITSGGPQLAVGPGERYSGGRLSCLHCGVSFDDEVLHSLHMGCHSHRDPFICNVCGLYCNDRYGFYAHIMHGHHDCLQSP